MTIDFPTQYPAEATNAAWQKKKSFLDKAKAKTKTGLGAELVKAEAAWKKISFKDLDADQLKLSSSSDLDDLLTAQAAAKKLVSGQVKITESLLKTTVKLAAETSKLKGLSKDAAKAALEISKKLEEKRDNLEKINLDDFEKLVEPAKKYQKNIRNYAREAVEQLTKALDAVEKEPTRARWEQEDVQEGFGKVQNSVRGIKALKEAHWDNWAKLNGQHHTQHADLKVIASKLDKVKEKAAILELVRDANRKLDPIRGYTNTHR